MLIDIDFEAKDEQVKIVIAIENLKILRDYRNALYVIRACALDFDLEPELEIEDLEEICEKTAELEKDHFTVIIGPTEIEVDI